jgi:hypothetical protein
MAKYLLIHPYWRDKDAKCIHIYKLGVINMTTEIHLTNQLQTELNKIGSSLILQTEFNSVIKINTKDWAYAQVDNRSLQASIFAGLGDKYVQLEEKGIIACYSSTKDISEMAVIADKWVSKKINVWDLAKEHASINIADKYRDLLTLTNEQLINMRWTDLSDEIKKGHIAFRLDLFNSLREFFSYLFPFFSHDNFWFSTVIELPDDNFKSPVIFCNGDTIEIGLTVDNSQANKHFKTKDIDTAINKTKQLLPFDTKTAINPLKN